LYVQKSKLPLKVPKIKQKGKSGNIVPWFLASPGRPWQWSTLSQRNGIQSHNHFGVLTQENTDWIDQRTSKFLSMSQASNNPTQASSSSQDSGSVTTVTPSEILRMIKEELKPLLQRFNDLDYRLDDMEEQLKEMEGHIDSNEGETCGLSSVEASMKVLHHNPNPAPNPDPEEGLNPTPLCLYTTPTY
jgi:hypothetical protein